MTNRHKRVGKTTETLQGRYEETMARLQKIKDAGYKVVSIWGREFRKQLLQIPGLKKELGLQYYVNNSPINIRDAFYGGRTEATNIQQSQARGTNTVCGCNQSLPLHL